MTQIRSLTNAMASLVLRRFQSTKPVYKRTSRGRTRKERRYSGDDPAWMQYRQEMRTLRHEWIQEGQRETQERLALQQDKSEKEKMMAEKKAEAMATSLRQQDDILSEFGLAPAWPNTVQEKGMQLGDVIKMLDSQDDASPTTVSQDDLVAQRKLMWQRFVKLRRKARFQNYMSTEQQNSNNRLAHLLWMYHESSDWVTPENLDEKIDEVFNLGPKMYGTTEKNYRSFGSLDKMLTNYVETAGKNRLLAIQDALDDTITKSSEGAFSGPPKTYPDVEAVKQRIKEDTKRASEPLAPKPSSL